MLRTAGSAPRPGRPGRGGRGRGGRGRSGASRRRGRSGGSGHPRCRGEGPARRRRTGELRRIEHDEDGTHFGEVDRRRHGDPLVEADALLDLGERADEDPAREDGVDPRRDQSVADLGIGQVGDELQLEELVLPLRADHDPADPRALDDGAGSRFAVDQELDLGGVERRRLDDPPDHAGRRDDRHVHPQAARRPLVDGHGAENARRVAGDDGGGDGPQRRALAEVEQLLEVRRAERLGVLLEQLHLHLGQALPQLLVLLVGAAQAEVAVPHRSRPAEDPGRAELDLREHAEGHRLQHARPGRRADLCRNENHLRHEGGQEEVAGATVDLEQG